MFHRLRRRSKVFDLDDPSTVARRFDRVTDDDIRRECQAGNPPEHTTATTVYWLESFLRWALDASATAVHFLRDVDEACLRQLIYVPCTQQDQGYDWFEAAPMVESFATRGISDICKLTGLGKRSTTGTLEFIYRGEHRTATTVLESENDLAIYFQDDRPPLRRLDRAYAKPRPGQFPTIEGGYGTASDVPGASD